MTAELPREVLRSLDKLVILPDDAKKTTVALSVARLTVIRKLCKKPGSAVRFTNYLAHRVLRRNWVKDNPVLSPAERTRHRKMIVAAVEELDRLSDRPSAADRARLRKLYAELHDEQDNFDRQIREVNDPDMLLIEYALGGALATEKVAAWWAYKMAVRYAGRTGTRYGNGLVPDSAPYLKDVADFWLAEYGTTRASLARAPELEPSEMGRAISKGKRAARARAGFTRLQGQYLAFIHHYRTVNRRPPSETDIVKYFRSSSSSVHLMLLRLEEQGLISRKRGSHRSVKVTMPVKMIPELVAVGQAT